jgi:hypothetical protein
MVVAMLPDYSESPLLLLHQELDTDDSKSISFLELCAALKRLVSIPPRTCHFHRGILRNLN